MYRILLSLASVCLFRVEALGAIEERARLLRQEDQGKTRPSTEEEVEQRIERRVEAKVEQRLAKLEESVGELGNRASVAFEDGYGSRIPTKADANGVLQNLTLWERLRYLERKVDGGINWLKDPQVFRRVQHACKNVSDFGTDHHVCFDGAEERWQRPGGCVVYDLGIRANPDFGVSMMKLHGCKIRAYDPSPTSAKWWADKTGSANELNRPGSLYTFSPVGAGGADGKLELFDYNWDQVSVVRAENDYTLRPFGTYDDPPTGMSLPVKTLQTMMQDNHDTYIDVLKLDIEGSEYMFLQDMFDRMGCPPVGQMTIEWHNFDHDERYGSSKDINQFYNLLNGCGYKAFVSRDPWRVDPGVKMGSRKLPPSRLTLDSLCKDCF